MFWVAWILSRKFMLQKKEAENQLLNGQAQKSVRVPVVCTCFPSFLALLFWINVHWEIFSLPLPAHTRTRKEHTYKLLERVPIWKVWLWVPSATQGPERLLPCTQEAESVWKALTEPTRTENMKWTHSSVSILVSILHSGVLTFYIPPKIPRRNV